MTNEEEVVKLGDDAEALLKSDAFNRTVNQLVDATFQSFVNSKPEETEARANAYSHYRAVVDIVSTLQQRVAVRDQANDTAQGDNNQEE
jgi:hypothetical protein